MTRVIPAPLLAHLQGSPAFAGECLILEARDGTRVGFTTLDEPFDLDLELGDGVESCAGGIEIGSLTLSVGLTASFAEVSGPLGPVLTREAVEGGRWAGARAWLVRVSPGIAGYAPLLYGKVAEYRTEGPRFFLEIRNQAALLQQVLGRVISPYCSADLGDSRCTFSNTAVAATVTAVTDAMRFSLSFSGTYANDYFNYGTVEFTSGDLLGTLPVELFDWVSGGAGVGSLVLLEPLVEAPQIGDTLNLKRGCPKTRDACRDLFSNVLNFRGEPEVPGSNQVLKAQIPE
ncbi:DUF2163 domain-containing protein [Sphingorhabdus pulchriflava]|uniref:DUF2163 domain-containing protein n=1 Tax=Sphingorhabdus pulchriflava TaxID=2292257 RepID=A0A371BG09_9SPHN|nr:DUF2163 domain-containing protein [Sphingorhabdus pulchriflava]RDV06437.1 DUF2163 domain-containing protein [Sphingorhabdus pulchriflava]